MASQKGDAEPPEHTPTNQKLRSANLLLARLPEEEYIEEWTRLLSVEKVHETESEEEEISVIIFRLGKGWLALKTGLFLEIAQERNIHRIPHRSNQIVLGLVNLRGRLTLCVDLGRLLEMESEDHALLPNVKNPYKRMAAIQKEEESWIFSADEVHGVFHFPSDQLENVPVTVSKSKANYVKGVFNWQGNVVGLVDEDLLFFSLKRSVV